MFSNWLKVPITLWSFTKQIPYLCFNTKTTGYCYNLLFHDQTPAAGHFEPLLSYMSQQKNGHMSQTFFKNFDIDTSKNKEAEISSFQIILSQEGLHIVPQPNVDCHDSLFESICKFATLFDTYSLRKAIAQTFCNFLL